MNSDMKLYFDCDGVLRDLATAIYGYCPDKWDTKYQGHTVLEYVNKNLDILVNAPPTRYYRTIVRFLKGKRIHIITMQSDLWRPYTEKWIEEYFDVFDVTYVKKIEDKEKLLGPDDLIVEDYPLFPKSMASKLIMIDYPYNREAECLVRITSPKQLGEVMRSFTNNGKVI